MMSQAPVFFFLTADEENYFEIIRSQNLTLRLPFDQLCHQCSQLKSQIQNMFHYSKIDFIAPIHNNNSHHDHLEVSSPFGNHCLKSKILLSKNSNIENMFTSKPRSPLLHQQRFLKTFAASPRSMLVAFELGSGKTDAALFAADAVNVRQVIVVASKVVLGQWIDAIKCHTGSLKHYKLYGYQRFAKEVHEHPTMCRQSMVIVDEAHTWKGMSENCEGSIRALESAAFILLLTGTPIRNNPSDINSVLRILFQNTNRTEQLDFAIDDQKGADQVLNLRNCMRDRVVLYNPKVHMDAKQYQRFFREQERRLVYHHITWIQACHIAVLGQGVQIKVPAGENKFKKLLVNGKGGMLSQLSFMNGVTFEDENGDETLFSSKKDALISEIDRIGSSVGFPQVVYSRFKANMLSSLYDILCQKYEHVALLTGDIESKARHKIIRKYNNGKYKVVLICRVGNEGVDLAYPATAIHMLEVQHNLSEEEQIIGRVIRYRRLKQTVPSLQVVRYVGKQPDSKHMDSVAEDFVFYLYKNIKSINRWFDTFSKFKAWVTSEVNSTPLTVEEDIYKQNVQKATIVEPYNAALWMASSGSNSPLATKCMWYDLCGEIW